MRVRMASGGNGMGLCMAIADSIHSGLCDGDPQAAKTRVLSLLGPKIILCSVFGLF